MRKQHHVEDADRGDTKRDDVARWVESMATVVNPRDAATEDMRAITAKYAAQLGAAFSKVTKAA